MLLVVGGFGALLRVRLGLVVRPGPALAAEAARREVAGAARLPVTLLAVTLLAEVLVTVILLTVILAAEVLLRVTRLGRGPVTRLIAVAGLAGVARLLTRVRPTGTGGLFVTVAVVRPSAALAVADSAVRT